MNNGLMPLPLFLGGGLDGGKNVRNRHITDKVIKRNILLMNLFKKWKVNHEWKAKLFYR